MGTVDDSKITTKPEPLQPRRKSVLRDWRARYERLGFATIPLYPGSKRPVFEAWQLAPPTEQWRIADARDGGQWRGNLGIRCGNGLIVIDADEDHCPGTIDRIEQFLRDLKVCDVPRVNTPSGGQHFYLKVRDVPHDFNWSKLPDDFGAGELRARHAFVVAPCSSVADRRYVWSRGTCPEDWADLRPLAWRDLRDFQTPTATNASLTLTIPPVRLPHAERLPDYAYTLLSILTVAAKGQHIGSYASRSEAEAAVIAMGILSGWSLEELADLFERYLPGHYSDKNERARADYLETTYRAVLREIASSPERQIAAELYQRAESAPWPGRGARSDQRVYLALTALAWKVNDLNINASVRDVEQYASVSCSTVSKALRRLARRGLLQRRGRPRITCKTHHWDGRAVHRPCPLCAPLFRLPTAVLRQERLPSASASSVSAADNAPGAFELWTSSGLGQSAGLIYAHLTDAPQNVKALAAATGLSRRTVERGLNALANAQLSEKTARGAWRRGPADLTRVAREHGTKRAQERRRMRIDAEREAWSAWNHVHAAVGFSAHAPDSGIPASRPAAEQRQLSPHPPRPPARIRPFNCDSM